MPDGPMPEGNPMPVSRPGTDPLPHDQRRARRPQSPHPLRRSRHGPVGGVATGIAEFVAAEPRLVRWIFGLSLPLTIGVSGVAYVVLWALLPGPPSPSGNPSGDPAET